MGLNYSTELWMHTTNLDTKNLTVRTSSAVEAHVG